MRLALILSNDWEVFGDGSGDYHLVQHQPLKECLDVVERHGAFMTVLAEVGQQLWGFRKLGEREEWAARISEDWESIIRETVERGSDVQLHLHPQWIGSSYADRKWDLDYEKWAIGRLPYDQIVDALKKGKEYLEGLLKPVKPDYQCHSFRAGAYCIQPSANVIKALKELGFKADTSVTKGYYDASFYDYRKAASNHFPWLIETDVIAPSRQVENSLIEFPIYSFSMVDSLGLRAAVKGSKAKNLLYKMNFGVDYRTEDQAWFRERDRIREERYPSSNRPMQQSKSHKLKGLLSSKEGILSIAAWPTKVQLDYDYLPANVFVKAIERIFSERTALAKDREVDDLIIPVMASGHVKNMHNADNLDRILKLAKSTLGDRLTFWTLDDAVTYWSEPQHKALCID